MQCVNAAKLLPDHLLKEIQQYIQGKPCISRPARANAKNGAKAQGQPITIKSAMLRSVAASKKVQSWTNCVSNTGYR